MDPKLGSHSRDLTPSWVVNGILWKGNAVRTADFRRLPLSVQPSYVPNNVCMESNVRPRDNNWILNDIHQKYQNDYQPGNQGQQRYCWR